ncbi:hypothetical protein TNIN_144691 [Trichonephila inaurata madagascariensis]|uniref:DUF5641 domain-containing protein n=1 Tax=Trichonephila inaurata madagascariensis TaxID=2747483 RepID=A0A8X7CGM0_9ARAC|nr:hypothetical protein TNIN_144691 [Trichonephila inaurata madagascariensis]
MHWPLAKIIRQIPGKDGKIRTVEVRFELEQYYDPFIEYPCLPNIDVRIYCLHLATGRTIHTRSGSGPTIYRGGPGNDRGDQTEGDRTRGKRRACSKKPKARKRDRRKEDGWAMDRNLVPS